MEIQASPRSVEVKCSDVLHCQLGKVTVSPSFCSGSPLPPPVPRRPAVSPGAAAATAAPRPPNNGLPPALLLGPSRSPPSAWDSGMDRREKGEGELPDSQSGAAMGMEECEAADATRLGQRASELPSDDGGHPPAAVVAVVVLPGQVWGGHEGEALVGAAVLQQHVDALLAGGLAGVGQRRVPMGVARHHVHAVLRGEKRELLGAVVL